MEKRKTNERGITLISLVITIILLLILATVAISLAVDSDGLFSKAGDAANKWNTSVAEEQSLLNELLNYDNPVSKYVTDTETGREAPIPKGYVASQIQGENTIADGLVIYEGKEEVTGTKGSAEHENAMTTRNQYVWIPVDDINDMVMCSECGGSKENLVYDDTTQTLKCTNTHEKTPTLVGKLYIGEYTDTEDAEGNSIGQYEMNFERNDQIYSPQYLDEGYREPAVITGSDGTQYDGDTTNKYHGKETAEAFLTQLQSDFDKMAQSVAKYKGFYVGRYEVGVGGVSQKGKEVLNNGENSANMWYGLYNTLRSDTETSSSTYSQMIWGSQYDQVIKFIGTEAQIAHTDRNLAIDIPEEAGNNELDKMKNIYDLEGNYEEWTAEAGGDDNSSPGRAVRGRRWLYNGRKWSIQVGKLSFF